MATCPACGTSSRIEPGSITIEPVLIGGPIPGFAMTADQLETVVHEAFRMECRCGWTATGYIDGDYLVVNPPVDDAHPVDGE